MDTGEEGPSTVSAAISPEESNFEALSLQTDDHGYISSQDKQRFFDKFRAQSENRICFDCSARNASWISVSLSIYLCLTCSGQHRNLGSKVSFVRSTELDDIRLEEALRMEIGGNSRAKRFFRSHGVTDVIDYRSKIAEKYKRQLEKEVVELLSQHRPELQIRTSSNTASQTKLSADSSGVHDNDLSQYASGGLMTAKSTESSNEPSSTATTTVVVKEPQFITKENNLISKIPNNATTASSLTPHQMPTGSFFGSTVKAQQKAKVDDFDFDFDNAFAASQSSDVINRNSKTNAINHTQAKTSTYNNTKAYGGIGSSSGGSGLSKAVPLRDLTNAKSISAADFRENDSTQSNNDSKTGSKANMARFKNAQAISSDAFFNKDSHPARSGQSKWTDEEMTTRLAILREGAIQKASEVAGAAQETFKNAANWFSRVASSPSYQ